MNNNAIIKLSNGLGDKFLDLIGFFVLCKYLNYKPNVTFCNNGNFAWGSNNYDMRLFNFDEIILTDYECEFHVISSNPSSSLCPYKVFNFISEFLPEISFQQISNDFVLYSKKIIKPSEIILSKIPNDLENAYGIHLRKSDKVCNNCDIRHENTMNEFLTIINKLLEDVRNIIMNENEAKILIVSEDDDWKKVIINVIMDISNKINKPVKIVEIDYNNENNYLNLKSVLDMFCLSKCKEILQGVKYSSFSILASLIGNNKIRNYSNYTESYRHCLIHSWSSVIEINNMKSFDLELHNIITNNVENIHTNIDKKF